MLNEAGTSELDVDALVLAEQRVEEIASVLKQHLSSKRAQGYLRGG